MDFKMKLSIKPILAALGCLAALSLSGSAQTVSPMGKLPLFFEAGQGITADRTAFLARTADAQCTVSARGLTMNLRRAPGQISQLQMQFVGASPAAQIHGDTEQAGKINYLLGSDSAQWRTRVPTFAKVRVEKIYPGVDVVFYGNQDQLEYDFGFAAGADPAAVAMRFSGAEKLQVSPQGELVISLAGAEIRQPQPLIYQVINGSRQTITGGYKILADQTVVFNVGAYDHSQPLVIDPVLSYSTFFGGASGDTAWSVKLDPSGNVYVAGETLSAKFLTNVTGVYPTNAGGTLDGDAFVAKFDNLGTNLSYFTFLGGSGDDAAVGLAVDAAGHAFVAGVTDSTNFPVKNALYPKISGTNIMINGHQYGYHNDAFVAELSADGSALVYSTYFGGGGNDQATTIALDSSGDAYITGRTTSTNLPVTSNAYQSVLKCASSDYILTSGNAFVAEFSPGGTQLNYCSYLGGTNLDVGGGIAVDANNFVYVAGATSSTNFPTTNPLPGYKNLNGTTNASLNFDGFVTKFTPNCAGVVYSTFLGSSNYDVAARVVGDSAGNAYVIGSTASTNFPNTAGFVNYLTNNLNGYLTTNVFVTEINPAGTAILHSAVFGGLQTDFGYDLQINPVTGNIFIVGTTSSTNFPVTRNIFGSLCATNFGGDDVFVAAIKADWSGLLYAGYLGGYQNDYGYSIAVDAADNAYIVGQTLSTNFPTFNARQKTMNGTNDAFLAKIVLTTTTLNAQLSGTNFLVTVPPIGDMNTNNLSLETTTNLIGNSWSLVSQTSVLTNGVFTFKFNPTNKARFFRFH
jgi:hypothetical protein